jgi:antitoxin VapB
MWRRKPYSLPHGSPATPRPASPARIGWSNRAQTTSIPVDLRFPAAVREVFIRREVESIILTPRPYDRSGLFASAAKASSDFMAGVESSPGQERSF